MHGWNWRDASFVLLFASTLGAIAIPVVLSYWGSRSNKQLLRLERQQTESLDVLKAAEQTHRREQLLRELPEIADVSHLRMVSKEVFEESDFEGAVLRHLFRSNPHVPLPGAETTWVDTQKLSAEAIRGYFDGLGRRYERKDHPQAFLGLQEFLERCATDDPAALDSHLTELAALVTGPCALVQHPGHWFYADLTARFPRMATALLYQLSYINAVEHGGIKLNVLNGVLLTFKQAEQSSHSRFADQQLRRHLAQAFADLLHRGTFRSLDRWSTDGATDVITAGVAWLVLAVGHLSNVDSWLTMRMIENLPAAIGSISDSERYHGWGVDEVAVRTGFALMRQNSPVMWAQHGQELEEAATEIGEWNDAA